MNQLQVGRKGFTLIELMIVVVVIGILAAIAIPKFASVSDSAKESEAVPVLKQIYTLEARYKQRNDQYTNQFASMEGAADPVGAAKYYDFRIDGDATTFHACAMPKAGHDQLGSFQIDETQTLTKLASASACTGNAP